MYSSRQTTATPSKQKKSNPLRLILEGIFLLGWLFCTAIAGYFLGHTHKLSTAKSDCPPVVATTQIPIQKPCKKNSVPLSHSEPGDKDSAYAKSGYSLEEIEQMWTCSWAKASNISQVNQQITTKDNNLDKTKWKSVITVEPKAFFDRYLSQYPGDTRATQPVIVFSHKPLEKFEELEEVCKVIDVAVVPDEPGVCVAVTETFHDVASYHMLHAEKQEDGTFALTSNTVQDRVLPEEEHYASARALLLDFFSQTDRVANAVKRVPKFSQNKLAVVSLVESKDEFDLFKNSLKGSEAVGVSRSIYCMFTSDKDVAQVAKNELSDLLVISLPQLRSIGGTKLDPKMRRMFLQAWLAFAVAASGNKVLWQSPGSLLRTKPEDIVTHAPVVEVMWAYRGRKDVRAAPFFNSLDFFVVTGAERAVHLMHEFVLHFDLVLAWGSLDALAAYRLAENNARYGTTTYLLPPYQVLHAEMLGYDAERLREAAEKPQKLKAIVIPTEGITTSQSKKLLQDAGLWYL